MDGLLPWPTDASGALAIQKTLIDRLCIQDKFAALNTVAGVDVSHDPKEDISIAAIVLMKLEDLSVLVSVVDKMPTVFPYVPGLLSFREIPVILRAFGQLPEAPDLLMVDGQGIAHPRRVGIAAHLGILTDIPSLGIAKSRLTGVFKDLGHEKGHYVPLLDKDQKEIIGTVLRSKKRANPLFISPGHRISHDTALKLTLRCLTKYRLPEPTRLADKLSKNKGTLSYS
jgi:deoxyribonuclease V